MAEKENIKDKLENLKEGHRKSNKDIIESLFAILGYLKNNTDVDNPTSQTQMRKVEEISEYLGTKSTFHNKMVNMAIALDSADGVTLNERRDCRLMFDSIDALIKEYESDEYFDDDDDGSDALPIATGGKNYITPQGYARLRAELLTLIDDERPKVVDIVHWAASNGDRSENGDYLYGKKRLREIDRRIRFLTKRLEIAEVVDPSAHAGSDQVFFGATVTYVDDEGVERTVTILGVDEADNARQQVSWISPVARALLKAREGEEVALQTPAGMRSLEILSVAYPTPR